MKSRNALTITIAICFLIVVGAVLWLAGFDVAVLNPKGWVALKQRNLMLYATLLMLIVVIPVFVLTFYISWKYRADNKKAKYHPEWDYSLLAELIWWGFPLAIVVVLSLLTWKSSHSLDPFKPLDPTKESMTIQVVALDWKWLFIYPDHNIATVNHVQFPEKTPIKFQITADAPMNSFWIPRLAGQIYAMPGMSSELHLIADQEGHFRGSSANLSGKGFAGMRFVAHACTEDEFLQWVDKVQKSPAILDYSALVKPSENVPPAYYQLKVEGLYDEIIMKYMHPQRN